MKLRFFLLVYILAAAAACTRPAAPAAQLPTALTATDPISPTPCMISVTPDETFTPEPTMTPEPTGTPEPTATPEPRRFADKFVTGDPVRTEDTYQSDRIAIFLTHVSDDSKTFSRQPLVYHLADVYLDDPTDFRAAFTNDDFEHKYAYPFAGIAETNRAILAISGDFIRFRPEGLCVRNGVVYRTKPDPARDVCAFYRDGRMETFDANLVPKDLTENPDVWHIIGFGPSLLDADGKAKTEFRTTVAGHNPRMVIGYYEPGHYGLLFVEGRQQGYSMGLRMEGLAKLCESLGFAAAFNLDGGASACMYYNGAQLGMDPSDRPLHDIFYLAEP